MSNSYAVKTLSLWVHAVVWGLLLPGCFLCQTSPTLGRLRLDSSVLSFCQRIRHRHVGWSAFEATNWFGTVFTFYCSSLSPDGSWNSSIRPIDLVMQ